MSSQFRIGTPRREVWAASLLVIGLILVIVSFSWIDSPGLASSPDAQTRTAKASSVSAPVELSPDAAAAGETEETESPNDGTLIQEDEQTELAGVTSSHWFALDPESDDRIAGMGEDEEVPIASTVKIVTALVTLQHADLDEEVTIEPGDLVDPMVYSNMALVAGDTLTVEQLLTGLLVSSGSDAANALARYVGAKVGEDPDPAAATAVFVDLMNNYVAEQGLEHTFFANPSGDDDPEGHSSARDLAMLGAALMEESALAEIVAMPDYSFESSGFGGTYTGYNTNQMLGADGIVGIKTGSTEDAGGCLVLARESADGGLQIIAILGADLEYSENIITLDSRWDDARAIIAYLDANA